MRWFEHHTSDRDSAHVKIIRSKFGAEGYGIYFALIEVIGSNVNENNYEEWGCVAPIHDKNSLATECSVSVQKLEKFLEFCNEKNIFLKKDGKLYSPLIHERLDNYAKRIARDIKTKDKKVQTKSEQNTDKVRTKSKATTTLQIQHNTDTNTDTKKQEKKLSSSIEYLRNIPLHDIQEFTTRFEMSEKQLRSKAEDLINWLEANGKIKRNYKAFLLNAVKNDFKERVVNQPIFNLPDKSETVSHEKFQELREKTMGLVRSM